MSIKITTMIENKDGCDLKGEFGLSLFIEDEDFSFIFDTGKTGAFAENAEKMNIPLKDVKHLILSHSHYDHTGGVKTFIENYTSDFTLHISRNFFQEKYRINTLVNTFLGNNFDEEYIRKHGVKIHFLENDDYKISKNITLFTNFKSINDFEKPTPYYFRKIYNNYILDKMEDEVALGIDTKDGLLVICGCSHIGIANIVENIKRRTNKKIFGIIGGLHLSKAEDERMEKVLNYFVENDIKFLGVSHCTGEKFIEKLKSRKLNFVYNNTGNVFSFEQKQ